MWGTRHFWQGRYYDFNVGTTKKRIEKVRYIHRNPGKRGLVAKPQDWPWSSYRNYLTGELGTVEIESPMSAWKQRQAAAQIQTSSPGVTKTPLKPSASPRVERGTQFVA